MYKKCVSLLLILFPLVIFSQSPGTSFLDGKFIAPVSARVIISKDGANELILVAKPNGNKIYTVTDFKFPKAYTTGTAYTLAVKTISPGIACKIEKRIRDTVGLSPGFIRVGADYTYDHISRSSDNKTLATNYESQSPVVGGDFSEEGRYIAFVSSAVGFAGGSCKRRQIFWRDRNTGTTKLISAALNGEEGNGDCYAPAVSADGLHVAFESHASNLVFEDKNGVKDIFIWHSVTNKIEKVSMGNDGKKANAESY